MLDFLGGNWDVVLPLIAAVVVLFFPQFKPIVDLFLKKKPEPAPGPDTNPDDTKPTPIIDALKALLLVINHANKAGNEAAESAARETAKKLFDTTKE